MGGGGWWWSITMCTAVIWGKQWQPGHRSMNLRFMVLTGTHTVWGLRCLWQFLSLYLHLITITSKYLSLTGRTKCGQYVKRIFLKNFTIKCGPYIICHGWLMHHFLSFVDASLLMGGWCITSYGCLMHQFMWFMHQSLWLVDDLLLCVLLVSLLCQFVLVADYLFHRGYGLELLAPVAMVIILKHWNTDSNGRYSAVVFFTSPELLRGPVYPQTPPLWRTHDSPCFGQP